MLSINSVWFAGGKFGVSLRLYQCIAKPIRRVMGLKIDDSDSDDEDEVTSQPAGNITVFFGYHH